ncbi:hypothetical protein Anas_08454 [Armadillidium nasatum]|uniref:C2H2-type domain-containing protein n=1 Tax=Armadillidium nasatum TaxID=96803 RepID=A0A5N5SPE9_9CRUS|nr:hypothetical protein Anas_08454 [Armadillidium nasatum]
MRKDGLKWTCTFPGCSHQELYKSSLSLHIRKHTEKLVFVFKLFKHTIYNICLIIQCCIV